MAIHLGKTHSAQEAEEINKAYRQLNSYHGSVRQGYKGMIGPLYRQRDALREIRRSISSATRNTHVGTTQCCEALDSAIEKLTKAINRLSNL